MERIRSEGHMMQTQRGFIALISVLLISSLLFLLMAAANTASYLAHQAASDEYAYRTAQQAAFSCARFAVARLDSDALRFSSASTTSILLSDDSECDIFSASSTQNTASASTQGRKGDSRVPVYVTASRASATAYFHLDTWTEY